MSRTDKTRPAWVQFRDPLNRRYMSEEHNHHHGRCDLDDWMESRCDWMHYSGRWLHCYLWHSYYRPWHGEFHERPGGRPTIHRAARASWVRQRQKMLATKDWDDHLEPRHHQLNSWKQEVWYDVGEAMTDIVWDDAFGVQVARMAAGHINILLDQEEGCCPRCCGPCAALKWFQDSEIFDKALGFWFKQWDVDWDWLKDGRIDWTEINAQWFMTECHEGFDDDPQ